MFIAVNGLVSQKELDLSLHRKLLSAISISKY